MTDIQHRKPPAGLLAVLTHQRISGWQEKFRQHCAPRRIAGKLHPVVATKIKYFHGSGGGGLVTKGALNLTRAMESYEGYDVFTMGHIHENSARNDVRDSISFHATKGYYFNHKQIHSMITGTYKEEYMDGAYGWHVERGAPMKPVGGRILTIEYSRSKGENTDMAIRNIDSMKFPL